MDGNIILVSAGIVGSVGATVGIMLAVGSKIFHVEVDERIQIIYEMLPHFNCGSCGTPGCMAMAGELVNNKADVNRCKPSKPDGKAAINAKLKELGVETFS
jgi:Na+-translocating ferredoxin:NAD+ oxidoreductase subunit B